MKTNENGEIGRVHARIVHNALMVWVRSSGSN